MTNARLISSAGSTRSLWSPAAWRGLKPLAQCASSSWRSQTRVGGAQAGQREEAIVEVASQQRNVLQILRRLSLGIQQAFDSRDDFIAPGQERAQQLDMRLERHVDEMSCAGPSMSPRQGWRYGRSSDDRSKCAKRTPSQRTPAQISTPSTVSTTSHASSAAMTGPTSQFTTKNVTAAPTQCRQHAEREQQDLAREKHAAADRARRGRARRDSTRSAPTPERSARSRSGSRAGARKRTAWQTAMARGPTTFTSAGISNAAADSVTASNASHAITESTAIGASISPKTIWEPSSGIGFEDVRVLEIGTQVVARELRPEQQDDHQARWSRRLRRTPGLREARRSRATGTRPR